MSDLFYKFIIQSKHSNHIHRLGNVVLRHLGEMISQEMIWLRSASVTASVRLATPNLDSILLTCDLIVDGLTVNLPAERVVRVLEQLLFWRGKPTRIRMDNGPELISQRLACWAQEHHIDLLHIQPGKPAQNAYIERFNRTFREEVLDAYLFDDLEEVRTITEHWLDDYNTIRPHEALQGLPPRPFAQQHA